MQLWFTRRSGLLPWMIRAFTRSPVSHVAIYGVEFAGRKRLLHSTHGGLRVDEPDVWIERRKVEVVETWEILPNVDDAIPIITERLGDSYDFTNLVGNAIAIILYGLTFGRVNVRNIFASPELFVCSELVVNLDPGGLRIPDFRFLDPERTTAEDLRQLVRRSKSFKRVT